MKQNVDFAQLDAYIRELEEIGGEAVERAVDSALKASQQVVKAAVTAAMQEHRDPGATSGTIISGKPPEWTGGTARIPVGFDIGETDRHKKDDRLASVFLMYGTKVHGQPHEAPDRKLYNAVYGAATRRRIRRIQEEAFSKVLRRLKR